MFDAPIANLKYRLDLALKSSIGAMVACAAALVAVGFFCAALFLWLDERYGAIAAALVLGGIFTFFALVAALVVLILRGRAPPPPPPRQAAWWADPRLLAAALDVSRTLGKRRVATAVLVAAFVLGMMLRPPRKRDETRDEKPEE